MGGADETFEPSGKRAGGDKVFPARVNHAGWGTDGARVSSEAAGGESALEHVGELEGRLFEPRSQLTESTEDVVDILERARPWVDGEVVEGADGAACSGSARGGWSLEMVGHAPLKASAPGETGQRGGTAVAE